MSSPPSGEEEEEGVVVMASLQLLLPFCCKGAPLPRRPPSPAAEATTFTGAVCIASTLFPFLSLTFLIQQNKINPKTTDKFSSGFLKKHFKLNFSQSTNSDCSSDCIKRRRRRTSLPSFPRRLPGSQSLASAYIGSSLV
jgi:hypothetical protein